MAPTSSSFPRPGPFRVWNTCGSWPRRAIENQGYVILANRVGRDEGAPFCGSSAMIDPYGVVVAAASPDRTELIMADLSQEVLDHVRERMQVFAHRYGDLYEKVPVAR
jgi:omega-amidase